MEDWHFCKHCDDVIDNFDNIFEHKCFKGKNVYSDDCGNLYAKSSDEESGEISKDGPSVSKEKVTDDAGCSKSSMGSSLQQTVVWTKNATMCLLSLYEANKDILDNPRKKTKIWNILSQGLKEANIQMSSEQVRWKFNRLQKKYKECVDNNKKSGRAHMTFEFFDQMDDIFCPNKDDVAEAVTISSMVVSPRKVLKSIPIPQSTKPKQECENLQLRKPSTIVAKSKDNDSHTVAKLCESENKITNSQRKKTKEELERSYLHHLKTIEEQQKVRDEKIDNYRKVKADALLIKKQELALREKELEFKQTSANKKIKLKHERHDEIMKLEREKCDLLRKLLNRKKDEESDSD